MENLPVFIMAKHTHDYSDRDKVLEGEGLGKISVKSGKLFSH